MTRVLVASGTVLFALAIVPAVADCPMRPATSAEKTMIASTLRSLAAAMPAAPAGWELEEQTDFAVPDDVCEGFEASPMRVTFRRKYVRQEGYEAAQAEAERRESELVERERNERAASGAEAADAARLAKIEAIAKRIGDAVAAGNMKEAERAQKELERLQAQIGEPGSDPIVKDFRAAENAAHKDRVIEVSITVNPYSVRIAHLRPLTVAGAAKAFSGPDGREDDGDYEVANALVGRWQPGDEGYLRPANAPGHAHTLVQSVLVRVYADKARLPALLHGVNLSALGSLIK